MCINVYANFKDNVLRVKYKILFSPSISHHVYAIGMSVCEARRRGEGPLYSNICKV